MVIKMIVRKAQKKDIPELLVLLKQLFANSTTLEEAEKRCEIIFQNPDYYLIVVEDEGHVMGSALTVKCTAFIETFLLVENVIVKEGCRKKGYGRVIMEKVDSLAAENDCNYTILVSSGQRKEAHAFYEKMGYTDFVRGFRKRYRNPK